MNTPPKDLLGAELAQTEQSVKSLRRTGRYFIAIAILLGLGLLYNGWRTFDLSLDTKQDIRTTQLESCARGNEARVARVLNYYRDIQIIKANLRFVNQFALTARADKFPVPLWQDLLRRAITYKNAAIDKEIDSIAQWAVRQGSAVMDCESAYPPL